MGEEYNVRKDILRSKAESYKIFLALQLRKTVVAKTAAGNRVLISFLRQREPQATSLFKG